MRRWFLACVLVAGCGDDGPAGPSTLTPDPDVETGCSPGPVTGTRVKVIACEDELITGRLAGGRVGDYVMENARVRVIIRSGAEGYYLNGTGPGGIIDAIRIGSEDLVKEIVPSIDLTAGAYDEQVITEAGDDGDAEIVFRGPARGIDYVEAALPQELPAVTIEHRYRLAAGATAIEMETRIFGDDPTQAHDLYDATFLGGRAVSADTVREVQATSGTTTSYGVAAPADGPNPGNLDLAGIRLTQGPDLYESGDSARRWLVIGDGSVSSVTDATFALRGQVVGTVTGTSAPGAEIVVMQDAEPITVGRADDDGAFAMDLPPGSYTLHAEAIGREVGADVDITVAEGGTEDADVPVGAGGTIALTVRDDADTPLPARVVLSRDGESDRITWTDATGDLMIPAAPGTTWRLTVSRGVEYDAFVADPVTVTDGGTTPLAAVLEHVVDTSGWISLDTHLHSELSPDSTFPVDDRLRACAGEGIEMPVSTDHDFIFDYAPVINEIGLADWMGSIVGEECSSIAWGHLNAFPLVANGDVAGNGAPSWLRRTPGALFDELHGSDGEDRIVQVNHPRSGGLGLFDKIDFDPVTMTANADPLNLNLPAGTDLDDFDFDAVEIANRSETNSFEAAFGDWLAMVANGHRAAATGSSDSHGASSYAGEARTYVYVGAGNDDPATVDPQAIIDAIHARHVLVVTGAFVTAGVVHPGGVSLPGETIDLAGQTDVTIHVTVQAAPWQSLASITIYQGTEIEEVIPLDAQDTAPVRYDADVVLPLPTADTFYVVRVDLEAPGEPVLDSSEMPSLTNPLFVTVP